MLPPITTRRRNIALSLSFDADISALAKELPDWAANRVPSITRNALNDAVEEGRFSEIDTIRGVFDRPIPFTEQSVVFPRHLRATKEHLEATLMVRDEAAKGTPPSKYLYAQVVGGPRAAKRFEVGLRRRGLLGPDEFVTIATRYPRDAYGNLPGALYVKMLSQLQGFSEVGFKANETKRSRKRAGTKRARYFVPPPGSKLRRGVYERQGSVTRAVLIFVRQPNYQVRYRFGEAAQTRIGRVFPAYWQRYFYAEVKKAAR